MGAETWKANDGCFGRLYIMNDDETQELSDCEKSSGREMDEGEELSDCEVKSGQEVNSDASDEGIDDRGYVNIRQKDNFKYLRPPGYFKDEREVGVEGGRKKRYTKRVAKDAIAGAKIRPFPENLGPSERRNEWNFLKQQIGAIIRLKPSLGTQQQKLDFLIAEGGREIQKALAGKEAADEVKDVKPMPVFDNAIKRLDEHFNTGTNTVSDIIRFRGLFQRKAEPFIDFVHRLRQHASFCEFGEAEDNEVILQIRHAAINREKLTEIMTREKKTLLEIINYGACLDTEDAAKALKQPEQTEETCKLVEVAANFRGKPSFRGSFRGARGNQYRGRASRGGRFVPFYRNESRFTSRGSDDKRGKCYECNQPGHIARYCPRNGVAYTKAEEGDLHENPYVWND